jgi:predicted PurR-regulated permease PerM
VPDRQSYLRPIAIGVAIVAVVYGLYRLADVLGLAFGAIVIATVLRAIARLVQRVHRMPERAAYFVALLLFFGLVAVSAWLAGGRIGQSVGQLVERLPQAIEAAHRWLASLPLGNAALDAVDSAASNALPIGRLAGFTRLTLGAVAGVLVVVVGGIYLAADPGLYRAGLLRLIPAAAKPRVEQALVTAGEKLHRWLLGQLVLMLAVGALSGVGLSLLGVPDALGLAVLAFTTEFVPYFGPLLFGAVAILLAFAQGLHQVVYVLLLTLAIHQLENHVLAPLVTRWAVSLPPALAVVSVVAFGELFGLPGVLFAAPLMIVTISLVESLYVEGALRKAPPR